MKKANLFATLLIGSLLVISSCKKDDAPPALTEQTLVGRWFLTEISQRLTGNAPPYKIDQCEEDDLFEFRSNKELYLVFGPNKCDANEGTDAPFGGWSLINGGKILTLNGFILLYDLSGITLEPFNVVSFNGTTLKLSTQGEGVIEDIASKTELELTFTKQ